MKSLVLKFIPVILIGLFFVGCSKIPPGNVGIKVYMTGDKKGVSNEVFPPGYYWIGPMTSLYVFPLFQQNYVWTRDEKEDNKNDESITFQTREGMDVNGDFGITFHIDEAKVPNLFQKYRLPIEDITHRVLRNKVRDKVNEFGSRMTVDSVYGVGKTTLVNEVRDAVALMVKPDGIEVENIYLIGKFHLPQAITDALNAKVASTQQAQQRANQVATAHAQAEIDSTKAAGEAIAIILTARAQAEAMRLKQNAISQNLVNYEWAIRWDGKMSQYMLGDKTMMMMGK